MKRIPVLFYILFMIFPELHAQVNQRQNHGLYTSVGAVARTPSLRGSNPLADADSHETMSGFGGNIGLTYYSGFGFNLSYNSNLRYDFIHYTDAFGDDYSENYEFISDHSIALTRSFRSNRKLKGYFGLGGSILNFNKGYNYTSSFPTFPSFYHELQTYTFDILAGLQLASWGIEPKILIDPKDNPFGSPKNPVYAMIRIYYQIPVLEFD